MSNPQQLVQKLWNYCNFLRDDGLTKGEYVEQLTLLLSLTMAAQQTHLTSCELSTMETLQGYDFVFEVCKILSLLIGCVLGIYGIIHDFKKDGKVTRPGRYAIIGFMVCGVIALSIEIHDFSEKQSAAQTANRQLQTNLLTQGRILARN